MSHRETIQEQIRRLRKELELSAREMSLELKRTDNHIWRIERGVMRPDLDSLVEIANFFAARGKHLHLVPPECVASGSKDSAA